MKNPYDDILHLAHHVSKNHPQMSMPDRAAQFSPFAALTGYKDAIDEIGRLTKERRELSEPEQSDLNTKLAFLIKHLKENPEISIEYFVADECKSGGSYQIITGRIKNISIPERFITLSDGKSLRMDGIASIDLKLFEKSIFSANH